MTSKVDAEAAVAGGWNTVPVNFCKRDLITYAIGIGSQDLRYIYENDKQFAPFPTYPIVLSFKGTDHDVVSFPSPAMRAGEKTKGIPPVAPGMGLDAERYLEVIRPIPKDGGEFVMKTRTIAVSDKGKGALVESESILCDKNGTEYTRLISGGFLRGLSGFKSAGKSFSENVKIPDRKPDAVVEEKTLPNQAHIYRLSGDYNPLHVDPVLAEKVGFKGPILHGLCSLGHASRHVLKQYGNNDPSRFKAVKLRFSSPVMPGETLQTEMWKEGNRIIFQTKVKERNVVVLNNAYMDLHGQSKL